MHGPCPICQQERDARHNCMRGLQYIPLVQGDMVTHLLLAIPVKPVPVKAPVAAPEPPAPPPPQPAEQPPAEPPKSPSEELTYYDMPIWV